MTREHTRESRDRALRDLPERARETFMSQELEDVFRDITVRHGLRVDQAGALSYETYLVALGLEDTKDFQKNLERKKEMRGVNLVPIIQDLNERFFKPIRASILEPELRQNISASDDNENISASETPDKSHDEALDELEQELETTKTTQAQTPTNKEASEMSEKTSELDNKEPSKDAGFVSKKLQNPVRAPRESGVVDPYREPIE